MAARPHSILPHPAARAAKGAAKRAAKGLGLAALGSAAAWVAYSRYGLDRRMPLPPALPGRREVLDTVSGGVSFYGSAETEGVPLLLVHSVNAAANAYEMRPLYLHYRKARPVYALELPGFGFSERARRLYTPRTMADAIHAVAGEVRRRHGGRLDAVALSISASYLARAALERAQDYRSLGLISPTGFDARLSGSGPPGGDRGGSGRTRAILDAPPLGRPLFDALVSRPSMRFFLEKTFGSKAIDEGLFEYDYASAHQPGAEHAPYCFIGGHLFPTDSTSLYEALRLPVWMVHGVRGDFVDFRHAPRFAGLPNWTIDCLPTGALPHFECLEAVTAGYDAFLDALP